MSDSFKVISDLRGQLQTAQARIEALEGQLTEKGDKAQGMTITFPPNSIHYGQDFRQRRGIPSGIEFSIEKQGEYYRLVAPGYGDAKDYGNGALYVDVQTMKVVLGHLDETPAVK